MHIYENVALKNMGFAITNNNLSTIQLAVQRADDYLEFEKVTKQDQPFFL